MSAILFASALVARSFAGDVSFLKKHVNTVVLQDGSRAVAVVPAYQGRVMTSTSNIKTAVGNGWINDDLIRSGKFVPHMNTFGGEDRFWLGPEGGQFSVFFKPGATFDLAAWQTPPLIDTEAFDVKTSSAKSVWFTRTGSLTNYSSTKFDFRIDRWVNLVSPSILGVQPSKDVNWVAYETKNKLTNTGQQTWDKGTGMLSIWILGMFKHSPTTTVVAPFQPGDPAEMGPEVNADYFGRVPADRLKVNKTKNFIAFKGDGQYRSKIGLNPMRAKDVIGSYDPVRGLLTICQYNKPEGVMDYVNSMWAIQDEPFRGDVINSYNDGPPAPGKKPLGPFYELESSSPAANLIRGASVVHIHRTFHFTGSEKSLDAISRKVLGIELADIRNVWK